MRVFMAYTSVVLIWATTPLAIHWSNTDFSFTAALGWRVVCAAFIGVVLLKYLGLRLVEHRRDWLNFLAGGIGLFPTMLFVYWAAKSVPSGVMSVVFGFFPFAAGLWTQLLYKENIFTSARLMALLVALLGLVMINLDRLSVGLSGVLGIGAVLVATSLWAFSSVLLKHLTPLPALRQSVGSCLVVVPPFSLVLLLSGDALPSELGLKSLLGIAYLVVVGSLLGHALFVYVLRHCSVASVGVIPLITPIIALLLGWLIEGDPITMVALVGVSLIVTALAIYQNVFSLLVRWFRVVPWLRLEKG